jgi:hypothetical protein
MDPGINIYCTQLLRAGMVGVAWPWIQAHLGLSPLERLNLVAKKCSQEVRPCQPLLPQLLKGLAHGLQLAEVFPGNQIPQQAGEWGAYL